MDHLQRLFQFLPMERGPQNRVPVHHRLPSTFERHHVHVCAERETKLLEVRTRVGRRQRVEEDALLERRKGVDPFDGLGCHPARLSDFPTAATSLSKSCWLIPAWTKSDGVKAACLGDRQCSIRERRRPIKSSATRS